MKILALDLSKFKSVGCVYEAESGKHGYRRVNTRPGELQHLVGRRTDIKNHVRELLVREGVILARGRKCWSQQGCDGLEEMARNWEEVGISELWRGELQSEMQQLQVIQERLREVEAKLETLAAADERVALLRT